MTATPTAPDPADKLLSWIEKSEYNESTGKYLYTITTGRGPLRISFKEEILLSPEARATRELGHLMLLRAVHKEKSTEFKPGTKITLLTGDKPLGETTRVQLHIESPQGQKVTTEERNLSTDAARHTGEPLLTRIEKKRKALWPERRGIDVFKQRAKPPIVGETVEQQPPAAAAAAEPPPAAAAAAAPPAAAATPRPVRRPPPPPPPRAAATPPTPGELAKTALDAAQRAQDALADINNPQKTVNDKGAARQRLAQAVDDAQRAAGRIPAGSDQKDAAERAVQDAQRYLADSNPPVDLDAQGREAGPH